MNKYKIEICEYFDNLTSKLDLLIESLIVNNHYDDNLVAEFNKCRDTFINEIRDAQAFNLKALSTLEPNKEPSKDDLFPKFCFFIKLTEPELRETYKYDKLAEKEINLRFVVTDKYLTDNQIKCYEGLFKFTRTSSHNHTNLLDVELFFEDHKQVVS